MKIRPELGEAIAKLVELFHQNPSNFAEQTLKTLQSGLIANGFDCNEFELFFCDEKLVETWKGSGDILNFYRHHLGEEKTASDFFESLRKTQPEYFQSVTACIDDYLKTRNQIMQQAGGKMNHPVIGWSASGLAFIIASFLVYRNRKRIGTWLFGEVKNQAQTDLSNGTVQQNLVDAVSAQTGITKTQIINAEIDNAEPQLIQDADNLATKVANQNQIDITRIRRKFIENPEKAFLEFKNEHPMLFDLKFGSGYQKYLDTQLKKNSAWLQKELEANTDEVIHSFMNNNPDILSKVATEMRLEIKPDNVESELAKYTTKLLRQAIKDNTKPNFSRDFSFLDAYQPVKDAKWTLDADMVMLGEMMDPDLTDELIKHYGGIDGFTSHLNALIAGIPDKEKALAEAVDGFDEFLQHAAYGPEEIKYYQILVNDIGDPRTAAFELYMLRKKFDADLSQLIHDRNAINWSTYAQNSKLFEDYQHMVINELVANMGPDIAKFVANKAALGPADIEKFAAQIAEATAQSQIDALVDNQIQIEIGNLEADTAAQLAEVVIKESAQLVEKADSELSQWIEQKIDDVVDR